MLIHLRPMFFYEHREVELIDLVFEPFALSLSGKTDLATHRPYPNNLFKVGCHRRGRRAINGILIETPEPVTEFSTTARWAVTADYVATHRIDFKVLDRDFDAVSDDPLLWRKTPDNHGGFPSRWPAWAGALKPPNIQAAFDIGLFNPLKPSCEETVDVHGRLIDRYTVLSVPTIERGRILHPGLAGDLRLPALESAFQVPFAPRSTKRSERRGR